MLQNGRKWDFTELVDKWYIIKKSEHYTNK